MKKLLTLLILLILNFAGFAQNKTVQVVMPECVNISGSVAIWLPGQVQDKLKSNLQEYLGMKTIVDSKSEATLKNLQRESENGGRDENTAIELGKISTAQFAVMTKIRKTGKGYTISTDYTDMTTGEQKATATSKEYKTTDELYESTGAIDEITLILSEKLNIAINPIQKQALKMGTADFSIDDQLKLAKQNEEQYKKLMSQFDEQLKSLSVSNDLNAVENAKKIEAEKALLAEKQQSEKKRLVELAEQKKKAEEDARLEAERSDEQKKKRDELASQAAEKAAEVRKLKMEKQGIFAQINVIESKKKALVEIRQGVEERIQDLHTQSEEDMKNETYRIRKKTWSSVELENGIPTEAARKRRENQIKEITEKLTQKFLTDAKAVKQAASKQDADLLAEIRKDQRSITKLRTVSSMGSELKVSYGVYSGENKGWNAYLSLYSEGILLYKDTFLIQYKSLTGDNAPDMEKASDKVVQKYIDTVDMYNSLFLRGAPILYFEIDYTVSALPDNQPSTYNFAFKEIRSINILNDKILQKDNLETNIEKRMLPIDIAEKLTVLELEQSRQVFIDSRSAERIEEVFKNFDAVKLPNSSVYISKNILDQSLLLIACDVCNELNRRIGLEPVYIPYEKSIVGKALNGITGTVFTTGGVILMYSLIGWPIGRSMVFLSTPFNRGTVTDLKQKKLIGFRLPTKAELKKYDKALLKTEWVTEDNHITIKDEFWNDTAWFEKAKTKRENEIRAFRVVFDLKN